MSEATQAGRIRQSEERCPDCGHVPKKYADLTEWGVALRDGTKVAYHKEPYCLRRQLAQAQAEIERLRRERDAALDVLGREDIGDGAKVEGVRLSLKGGDRGWPTRESERARLVAEVGECCLGADPLCAARCLVEVALRQRPVDKEGTA